MNKVRLSMLASLALLMGLVSCSNNEDQMNSGTGTLLKGEPTAMSLTVRAPRAPSTYADGDGNATDAEIALKSLNVLIYGQTSTGGYILEKNEKLDLNAFNKSGDTYTLKSEKAITSSTGPKKIYVAMNYPDETKLPKLNENLLALPSLVYELGDANSLSSNGIAMFSNAEVTKTLEAAPNKDVIPDANKITVVVKRMVAKVTVREKIARTGNDIISQDGKLTNIQFALGNINKTTNVIQNVVEGVVRSTNWTDLTSANLFGIDNYTLGSPTYQSVGDKDTDVLALNTAYAPEKTSQSYDPDGANLTYVSVRAQYQPAFFVNAAGEKIADNTAAAKTFWTVVNNDGSIMYFDAEATAKEYITNHSGTAKDTEPNEYTDGLCYFRAYINKNGVADGNITDSKAAKFDVLRNNYYQINIINMKAPGSSKDEGKVTEETSLTVDVQVQQWAVVNADYDLQ